MEYPNFVGPTNESHSFTADQEDTVNFYPEQQQYGSTVRWALCPVPGVEELSAHASGSGRAHFFNDDREFAVIGTDVIEVSQDGLTLTDRGNVSMGGNPATISSNGDGGGQLFITSGDNGYVYDLGTDVLTQVAALNGIATMGDQLDGYFIALDAATSKVYASDLTDGTTWSTGTSFAQRSGAPDPWVSIKVNGQYIWKFGQQTSEVWYDNAGVPYPFTRHPSGTIQYGIAAPFSAAVADGSMIWLGASATGNGFVLRAAGFTPEVISTPAVQFLINGFSTIDDAEADVLNYLGHTFYRIHFPSENKTLAYDLQSGQWFKWMTWISEDNDFVAARARWHVFAFGEHRALDSQTGSVYRVTKDVLVDVDGRELRRLRRAPALLQENGRVFYPGFELMCDVGLGTSGQGEDPQAMMRFSNDGGRTWSPEQMRSAGKTGEYYKRVRWTRCGSGRKRVFEVSMTDPIPWRIIGATLTPDPHVAGMKR